MEKSQVISKIAMVRKFMLNKCIVEPSNIKDYMKEKKSVSTTIGDKEYYITYHSVSETLEMVKPILSTYEISGNNVDGVIITRYR